MSCEAGYLLVRAGKRLVGLPVARVIGVIEPGTTYPVPAVGSAVRGVVTVRGRILPIVHLGAVLDGYSCPAEPGGTGVIVAVDDSGGLICLEVEEAELVLREPGLPVPPGAILPWAVAVARYGEELVPLLDLGALGGAEAIVSDTRLSEARPG
jgi:chemotaxis signal transduction protein